MGYFDEKIKGKPPAAILIGAMFLAMGLIFLIVRDPSEPMSYGIFRGLPSGLLAGVIAAFGVGFIVFGVVRILQGRDRL